MTDKNREIEEIEIDADADSGAGKEPDWLDEDRILENDAGESSEEKRVMNAVSESMAEQHDAYEPDYIDKMQERSEDTLKEERPLRVKRSRKKGTQKPEKTDFQDGEIMKGEKLSRGEEKENGEKQKKKKKRAVAAGVTALLVLILAAGGIYAAVAQKYKSVFLPGTQINGLDAAGLTVAEVKEHISQGIENYTLKIVDRDGRTEEIDGASIGLHPEFDGSLEKLMAAQNPYDWLTSRFNAAAYTIDAMVAYDEEALAEQIRSLECMSTEEVTEPVNAAVSEYVSGQGYTIVPETEGNVIEEQKLLEAVSNAIINFQDTLSLDEAGVYREPEIRQDDPELIKQVEERNRLAGVVITYQFGDKTEVLDGERIHEWLITDEQGNVTLDTQQVAKYVEELAITYNTANKAKTLKTSYGKTIQVKGGSYGWKINQSEETVQLTAAISSGESQTREPVYSQTAASHGENDYGDTYVEINLTAQHLFFYKNGSLVVESDFVSGNLSKGWGTPAGTYPLTYKQRDAVLKGENYRTPVDYWMPFNGGIGMHDATWRSTFGGTIYKTSGSHGCINLPYSVAKKIYENISAGVPVICYNLEGTEQGSASSGTQTPETQAPQTPETQAPQTPETQAPQAPETQAPQTPETQAPQTPETQAPAQAPAGPASDVGGHTGVGPGSTP